MHWLLNKRNIDANGHKQLNENLVKLGVKHSFSNIIPFSSELDESGIDLSTITDTIFPFGSFTMAKILRDNGYTKGVFMSDNISFSSLVSNWKDYLLNSDAIIGRLGDMQPIGDTFFVRPNGDSKMFPAEVTTREEFIAYQAKFNSDNKNPAFAWGLTPDTLIVMATPKQIQAEYRMFIVDKKVACCSMYRINGNAMLSANVDEYLIEFAEHVANKWSPELVYVMDIAISNGEPKVLEVNGVHASGLYACDTQRFIMAVEALNL